MGRPISAERRERRQMPLDEKRRHQIRHRLNWHRTTVPHALRRDSPAVPASTLTATPTRLGSSVTPALRKRSFRSRSSRSTRSGRASWRPVRHCPTSAAQSFVRRSVGDAAGGMVSGPVRPLLNLPTRTRSACSETRDRLRRALTALPRRQRAAVVLRHHLDVEEAETAAVLGSSTGTGGKLPRPSSGNRVAWRGDVTDEGLLAGAPVLGGPQHRPCRRRERPPRARRRAG